MKLYFAGPLFSNAELAFNQQLTAKIEALGYQVFLPQRDGDSVNQEPIVSMAPEERAREIFKLDKTHLLETDVFLYVLDGRIPDEGAAVALGMAHMYKETVKGDMTLVGLHTDKRAAFIESKLNPMIYASLDLILKTEEELLKSLDEILFKRK
jgi:nucleoside 2-deoxyribosyltransferase